jgi:hypothetical protein
MTSDLEIRCACGTLRGVVRDVVPGEGNRGVCYCTDCQSFAHFLGGADAILDSYGGTSIFQLSQGRVAITQGEQRLACMRLTPKGLLRWYAACCRTPLGNTSSSPGIPTVGLVERCLAPARNGVSLDEVLGPARFHVFSRSARRPQAGAPSVGSPPIGRSSWADLGALLRMLGMVMRARLRGEGKRSPFFDTATGAPRATPRVLTPDELRAVETARDAV